MRTEKSLKVYSQFYYSNKYNFFTTFFIGSSDYNVKTSNSDI